MVQSNRLQVLGTEEVAEQPPPQTPTISTPSPSENAWAVVALGLKVLSQRTLVLLGHSISLLALAGGFFLFNSVLPNPNSYQLVGLAIYAVFALAMIAIKGR